MRRELLSLPLCLASALVATGTQAQVRLDRADPTITEQALPLPAKPVADASLHVEREQAAEPQLDTAPPRIATAIIVDGNQAVPTQQFAPVLVDYIGRDLSRADLAKLASAIAGVAHQAGYPFANARIEPQAMVDGVLHVRLDEGRIAAVRVIGAKNAFADRLLTHALVTDAPVRRDMLERAIMLVGDIAGLTVKDSKYIVQNGFGILLVTAEQDRASVYTQIDNRGSNEVGPLRATVLANYRGLIDAGDEIGLIGATTPTETSEFAFLRLRYSAPIDLSGSMLSVSGSFGRANPGGWLKPLNVVGESVDVGVAYTTPLLRSRAHSLWFGLEFRALHTDQTMLGRTLRDDRIATLTASLNGTSTIAAGTLRGEISVVAGLPIAGVSRQGDALVSRADGDARVVSWGSTADWTRQISDVFSVNLASIGQVASRPLLATAEIGLGGPTFGRAYDYAERTGDEGVMGSAELRADLGRVSDVVDRLQLYGFFDGGYVDNLGNGVGGGSLLSTGTGARLGHGMLDGMIEIAFPVSDDRFDTGNKNPRVSVRVARRF